VQVLEETHETPVNADPLPAAGLDWTDTRQAVPSQTSARANVFPVLSVYLPTATQLIALPHETLASVVDAAPETGGMFSTVQP
jgi:hypothetical protein